MHQPDRVTSHHHCAEVHGVFDDGGVVGDAKRHRVDRVSKRCRVFVAGELLQKLLASRDGCIVEVLLWERGGTGGVVQSGE